MELHYLETHLVDHCNLNCKGCSHFCPLVEEKVFKDIKVFKRDLNRLGEVFSNIESLRLMGGEPLLHPELLDFVIHSRKVFPRSDISIITNGILLKSQKDEFWEVLSKQNIFLLINSYPIRLDTKYIKKKCAEFNVKYHLILHTTKFRKSVNAKPLNGKNTKHTFNNCRIIFNAPFLDDGFIYTCSRGALYKYFNKKFGDLIETDDNKNRINIENASGEEIIEFLKQPIPLCEQCLSAPPTFDWGISKNRIEEWVGENNKGYKNFILINKHRLINTVREIKRVKKKISRNISNF
jgi:organic radical activating enzyme